jgi:hypothetical protein
MKPEKNAVTKPAVPAVAAPERKTAKPGGLRWRNDPCDYRGVSLDNKAAQEIFGTDSILAILNMTHILEMGLGKSKDDHALELAFNTIQAIKPRDPVEAMLVAELVMLHGQMARMLHVSRQDQLRFDHFFKAVAAARELSKAYQQGMETLSRYRSGGKQQVVVSHVAVAAGGQAAIAVGGDVRGGGGGADESKRSTP